MPLSWNEIKDRALGFSREWAGEASEHAEAKTFWDGFFEVFGVSRRRVAIKAAAQAILDTRARFPGSTPADLYDPLTMPPALVKDHHTLDRAVDTAYLATEKAAGRKPPKLTTDTERVAFLFQRYQAITSPLPADKPARRTRAKPRRVG